MFDQTTTPYGVPMMAGYNYNGMQGQPMQKFNNPLTADQIKALQQKGSQFSLGLTKDEQLRGICNHRNAEGTGDTLVFDPIANRAKCSICGYEFRPVDAAISQEQLKDAVDSIVDILQTIKLMYIDLPAEAAIEYFQIIPLIEKIPQLFEFAAKNMNKHEVSMWQYNNANMGTMTMFQNLQNMLGNMNQQMVQPQFGMQQPYPTAPMGYAAPQQAYPVGAMAPVTNGFGYPGAGQQPGFGYQPQATGFQYTPGTTPVAPVPPTSDAPAAPVNSGEEVTVTQTVQA